MKALRHWNLHSAFSSTSNGKNSWNICVIFDLKTYELYFDTKTGNIIHDVLMTLCKTCLCLHFGISAIIRWK